MPGFPPRATDLIGLRWGPGYWRLKKKSSGESNNQLGLKSTKAEQFCLMFFCEVLQKLPHQNKEQNSELLGFILSLGLVALQNSVAFVFPFLKWF